ncbi:MAG: UDP-N-acetylglucosamine 1-carboxyvinyltransferase [Candidatus Neomarinimicrobiota bacterium]|nr:UDP-N-acetylglucosamine 1-carboxyvinyltransferase [Candidatus Neomarinimicrobiota bacterium]|tara:strand:- start:960 stop:2210 length:1251 start_codon:yes stop_codon:yes gene_type:complete
MDKFVVNGGNQISGTVDISGAKNAVLPLMTAALLVDGKTTINSVPDLRDTRTMIRLLEIIGANVAFKNNSLSIDASDVNNLEAPYDLVKTMRASFYVLGPLLARFGEVRVSLPGGCAWGPRPVDFHLKGLEQLGAKISLESGYILAKAEYLKGNKISFDFPSVGATGNILMASVLARGETQIENAAKEPEIVQLCEMLNQMGANIIGIGTDKITVNGVDKLHPVDIDVIPDRIEAGTYLIAGATMGDITLNNCNPKHLNDVINKLKLSGANITSTENSVSIEKIDTIKAVDLTTEVYPGFPTDLQAQWMAFMSIAKGKSIIIDTVYHDRFTHIPELNRLGADIQLTDNKAVVNGVNKLKGAQVMSTDIRASAALILGAIIAEGKTEISRVYHIDRGYDSIEKKFRNLGVDISRVNE